jgi:hypothetical protein
MIWIYNKRRTELRERFGITVVHNGHTKLPDEYKKQSAKLNKKIGAWNREIRKIDMKTKKIIKLKRSVEMFTGEDIDNQVGYRVPESVKLAKCIYYKFGLENGLLGTLLSECIGSQVQQPRKYRKMFTKSFTTTPKNKEVWLRFKAFYDKNNKVA